MPWICLLLAHLLGLLQLPGLGVLELKGARLRVWWSGIHHVAVEPLDVARSKDLINTPNWVYFGVFPVDLGALHVVVSHVGRGSAQCCERRPNLGAEPRATSPGSCVRLSLGDRRAALADL